MRYSRRDFLKTAALGAATLGAASVLGRVRAWADDAPLVKVTQVTSPGVMGDTGPDPARVLAMVRRGLLEVTGQPTIPAAWGRFLKPTDVVGLKISTLGAPVLSTHRAVVLALAQTLQETGVPADHLVVWDRSAADLARDGWAPGGAPGQLQVAASDAAGYDELTYFDCDPPSDAGERRSHFSKVLTKRLTKVVNVPVLRQLENCGFGFALENLADGCCDNDLRGRANHGADWLPFVFSQAPLQRQVTFLIGDALRPQYADGPAGNAGMQWNCDSLIFALGQVSADAVGLAILDQKRQELGLTPISQTVDKPDYLAAAGAAGLGISDLSKILWNKVTV